MRWRTLLMAPSPSTTTILSSVGRVCACSGGKAIKKESPMQSDFTPHFKYVFIESRSYLMYTSRGGLNVDPQGIPNIIEQFDRRMRQTPSKNMGSACAKLRKGGNIWKWLAKDSE